MQTLNKTTTDALNSYLEKDSPLCQYNWCGFFCQNKAKKHENSIKQQKTHKHLMVLEGDCSNEYIVSMCL